MIEVLHPQTKAQVAQFLNQPGHALLLIGADGIGKRSLADTIAAHVLEIGKDKLSDYPYFTVVVPEKNTISIDMIRQLQRFMQLKTVGKRPLRRIVIIESAACMTTEAQNAFLKLLEEPPADTVLLLTVDTPRSLLPTILSRTQTLTVHAPEEAALKTFFADRGKQPAAIQQAYFLSGGLPGLMYGLLDDSETHPLLSGVTTAKELLQKTLFERLVLAEQLSKQKDETRHTITALQHIAQTGLNQSAKKQSDSKVRQWHHVLKVATEAQIALEHNANPKLVLTNMMLHM